MTPHRPNVPATASASAKFACAGYLWSANTGWIHCGDGTPADNI
jgi:hypothetical protein